MPNEELKKQIGDLTKRIDDIEKFDLKVIDHSHTGFQSDKVRVQNLDDVLGSILTPTQKTDLTDAEETALHTHAGFTSKARAYLGSGQTIGSGSWVKIELDTENYDIDSEFDKDTNNRFMATTEGYYQVNVACQLDNILDDKQYIVAIYKNGSIHSRLSQIGAGTFILSGAISDVIFLEATQYVELFVFHTTGVNETAESGSEKTFMSVHRLS